MSATPTPNQPRGGGLRLTMVLPLAAIVTAGLFLVMGGLIKGDEVVTGTPKDIPQIVFKPQIVDSDPTPIDTTRPELTVSPPPDTPQSTWETAGPDVIDVGPGPVDTKGTGSETGPVTITAGAAVLQIQPQYPPRCASRGAEGRVTVMFDVLASGAVTNARIVSSSDSCFDRAALAAINDWKFMPSAGRSGVVQSGVTKTFDFRLQG